uniref:Transposase (putative) YhgA-like domain-containing protein n=1 Tax=Candidatus Kentrum sp. SD TaxID=2126332 RepID=A0A450YHK5_9GAMM|nr:MAG: conserved hypothetical protein (putative transposase or invertase) [Candidatus Kentron sp. SD]
MSKIPQPHDRFVKELLSHPERAGTLLRERLPDEVARFLSDKPPEPVPGSFVDETLEEHRSDRLFKVETIHGRPAFLYVLIEHKSSPDEQIGLQLLRYMVEILKRWEKSNPNWKRLPAIVPFVVYHGAREWKIPTEFGRFIDAEEAWGSYLLNFRFPVLDLGEIPDNRLSDNPRLRVWLLAMKYATRGNRQIGGKGVIDPGAPGRPGGSPPHRCLPDTDLHLRRTNAARNYSSGKTRGDRCNDVSICPGYYRWKAEMAGNGSARKS